MGLVFSCETHWREKPSSTTSYVVIFIYARIENAQNSLSNEYYLGSLKINLLLK